MLFRHADWAPNPQMLQTQNALQKSYESIRNVAGRACSRLAFLGARNKLVDVYNVYCARTVAKSHHIICLLRAAFWANLQFAWLICTLLAISKTMFFVV